jgi:hypothetical protein
MAAGDDRDATAKESVLVESDFLFGLSESDSRHSHVLNCLKKHEQGKIAIQILSSAVIEVRSVLYSRGLDKSQIEEFFSLMADLVTNYGITEFVPLEFGDVIIAERLRAESSALTFFDSLHAATSKRLNLRILSSEGIYGRIGLHVVDLDKM